MQILGIVVPVFMMILIGMFCRKTNLIQRDGAHQIKVVVIKIMLPVAIFHALATAEYDISTLWMVLIMLVMLIATFGAGYLLKPFMKNDYKKYLPFMVCEYEGGMMAYPLYISLVGSGNLSQIAVLDIAGLLFGFSIYMGLLGQAENNEKSDIKKLFTDALHNPAFIACILGIIAGMTGIINKLIASSAGVIYLETEHMITASLTAMILIVVGFDMQLNVKLLKPCIKTIICRMLVQGIAMFAVLTVVRNLFGINQIRDLAIIIYMSAPATFSMQTYLKKEDSSAYASTTNSLYCIVSIIVYTIMAAVI